jgi:hypothetical protein
MKRRALILSIAAGAAIAAGTWALADQLEDTLYIPLDSPAIQYDKVTPRDPVYRLYEKIEKGQVKLDYAPNGWGYLPSLLKQLDVNPDSQVLVFSKTSIQIDHISPRTPRAIYFNDDVAVGYVQQGEELELTGLDPVRGTYLYTIDTPESDKIGFSRRDDCLRCHQGPVSFGVPGMLISSIQPSSENLRDVHGAAFETDDRVPLSGRWGGWYVTGTTGMQHHLGNNVNLVYPLAPGGPANYETQNLTDLSKFFDTSRYLVPTSDIVALMTLEHQVRMTNLITRIGWDARIALEKGKLSEAQIEHLNSEIEQMVTYMVFAHAEPLKEPVKGVSSFTKTFPQRGPRDHQGRSLRDFDLQTRLFRYPVSYMIYSAAFDDLPSVVKARVYQRLYDVLSGKDQSKPFAHLAAADRRAALEILRDTKPNLPSYWTAASTK